MSSFRLRINTVSAFVTSRDQMEGTSRTAFVDCRTYIPSGQLRPRPTPYLFLQLAQSVHGFPYFVDPLRAFGYKAGYRLVVTCNHDFLARSYAVE
jgi:hypothetical protein